MSTQLDDKVIEVALRNLKVLGCKYIVVKADGTQLSEGELKLADPNEKPKQKRHKVNSFVDTGYREIVDAMEIGDRYTFECQGDYSAEAFQKVISARMASTFGKNNFKTMLKDATKVEAIRFA